MLRLTSLILFCFLFLSCDDATSAVENKEAKKDIIYSYSCLDSTFSAKPINKKIDKVSGILRDFAISKNSITDSMQTAYGKEFHQVMTEEGAFVILNNITVQKKLNTVLTDLLTVRKNPSKIDYSIYILKDTAINAFTFGGRIYITEAMLKKCQQNDALLYAIIGHEIGHSEVGHIKTTIQELELTNDIFGEQNGATFFELKKMLTASFNQKNELEADYYGIELTNELGYDVCTAVDFWKEMSSNENKFNELEDFFRTHPFSKLRAQCLSDHIRFNYGKSCGVDKSKMMPQIGQK